MPLQFSDTLADTVRIFFSNDGSTNFGGTSTSGPLSFNGDPFLSPDGTSLSSSSAEPVSMTRFTGSITMNPYGTFTISSAVPLAGFGSAGGGGGIVGFNGNSFPLFLTEPLDGPDADQPRTIAYQVF